MVDIAIVMSNFYFDVMHCTILCSINWHTRVYTVALKQKIYS